MSIGTSVGPASLDSAGPTAQEQPQGQRTATTTVTAGQRRRQDAARRTLDRMLPRLGDLPSDDVERLAGALAGLAVMAEAGKDINVKEAAHRARVSASTVRLWCARHGIGARAGGRWRVSAPRLSALISGSRS